MIFNTFDDTDIVTGRTTKVASGFWPNGVTNWSQSLFVDDFWDLTGSSATPSPSYGPSFYDIRRTMYYINVFPDATSKLNNDPYFICAYGHIGGSGSFLNETQSIKANPTRAIYTEFQNLLLGSADSMFTFESGSGTVNALDFFAISFSTYKMKDRIDEGAFEISFSGSNGIRTYVDDSSITAQSLNVYSLISGSLNSGIAPNAAYEGVGLFYPENGVVILNADKLSSAVGLKQVAGFTGFNSDGNGPYAYNSSSMGTDYTLNHKVILESIKLADSSNDINQMKVRKSEYVPARHYFVRIKNRDFNYSNNPTYVYDGSDNVHAKGTIRNSDFVSDPKTYPTTIGLYNDNNELVAVAKLSRPAVKSFDNELLVKIKIDF